MKALIKKFVTLFFGTADEAEMQKRGLNIGILFTAVNLMDYALVAVTGVIVGFLHFHAIPEWQIFLILWIGNLLLSGAVVLTYHRTGVDLTLMEGLRRLVNAAIAKARITGYLLEGIVLIRLLVWDGADQFIIFFQERLNSRRMKVAVFVAASGVQMAIWTWLYVLGYDSFTNLFHSIVH